MSEACVYTCVCVCPPQLWPCPSLLPLASPQPPLKTLCSGSTFCPRVPSGDLGAKPLTGPGSGPSLPGQDPLPGPHPVPELSVVSTSFSLSVQLHFVLNPQYGSHRDLSRLPAGLRFASADINDSTSPESPLTSQMTRSLCLALFSLPARAWWPHSLWASPLPSHWQISPYTCLLDIPQAPLPIEHPGPPLGFPGSSVPFLPTSCSHDPPHGPRPARSSPFQHLAFVWGLSPLLGYAPVSSLAPHPLTPVAMLWSALGLPKRLSDIGQIWSSIQSTNSGRGPTVGQASWSKPIRGLVPSCGRGTLSHVGRGAA